MRLLLDLLRKERVCNLSKRKFQRRGSGSLRDVGGDGFGHVPACAVLFPGMDIKQATASLLTGFHRVEKRARERKCLGVLNLKFNSGLQNSLSC